MAQARTREASGVTVNENANVRAQALRLIEEEKIPIAAIAREASVSTAEFIEWLGGGRKPADFVARISEFVANRVTIRHILSEVSNELRGNVGTKLIATAARIVIDIRDAADEEERRELSDHAMLYLDDIKWLIEIMARDQTLRYQLKPGDRVVVVKSGGKTVNTNA